MVVGLWATPGLHGRHIVGGTLWDVGGEAVFIHAAKATAFSTCSIIRKQHDNRIVTEALIVKSVKESADLFIGMRDECGKDFLLTGVHLFLIIAE